MIAGPQLQSLPATCLMFFSRCWLGPDGFKLASACCACLLSMHALLQSAYGLHTAHQHKSAIGCLQVCPAVQPDSGAVAGSLLAALCSRIAPGQLLPQRTAAATALAAYASQPANAAGICSWLCSPARCSPCSAERSNAGKGSDYQAMAQHVAQEPEAASTAQDANTAAEPGTSKHSTALLGDVAVLVNCSAADAR